jgi:hypothetical protein
MIVGLILPLFKEKIKLKTLWTNRDRFRAPLIHRIEKV